MTLITNHWLTQGILNKLSKLPSCTLKPSQCLTVSKGIPYQDHSLSRCSGSRSPLLPASPNNVLTGLFFASVLGTSSVSQSRRMRFLKCKSDYRPTPLTPPNSAMVPCCLQNENRLLTGIQGLHGCCVTHLLSLPCHALASVARCICCAPSGLRFMPLLMSLLFLEHPSFPWLFGNCFFSEFQSGVLSFLVNLPTPGSPLFLFSKHHPSVLHLFDCMFLSPVGCEAP